MHCNSYISHPDSLFEPKNTQMDSFDLKASGNKGIVCVSDTITLSVR